MARRKTGGKEGKKDGRFVANNLWGEGGREGDTLRKKLRENIKTILTIKPLTSTTVKFKLCSHIVSKLQIS